MPKLSKQNKMTRLKKRSDFVRVQKEGRKWISKGLIVEIAENQESAMRAGFTVSKRVSKLAVERNLVKRRLRSIASEILPDYNSHSLDLVLVGRVNCLKRDYSSLRQDVVWCLRKLNIEPTARSNKS